MEQAQFGMIGLGTMGRNFLLNVAENGFSAIGSDLDAEKRRLLLEEGKGFPLSAAESMSEFISRLAAPRSIMLLVPAGGAVDAVIGDLLPHLQTGDLIIDGGNSHFADTDRREGELAAKGIGFIGVGVSGGEAGARRGPSIMPGGKREFYEQIGPIFEAVSAKVDGEPCVAYIGKGPAGHFVKMVHNGIEYAMMQILAEAYDLMSRFFGMNHTEIADVFGEWNQGDLNSFLVEISETVLRKIDTETGNSLVDMILDTAGQKGTGKWTSQAALDFGIPIPTIDSSVSLRQISALRSLRLSISERFDCGGAQRPMTSDRPEYLATLRSAVLGAFIASYSQGLSLLAAASHEKGFGLDLEAIARIWRGGCIIRSRLLESIRQAFAANPELPNLLLDEQIASRQTGLIPEWRKAVSIFSDSGIPGSCIASALFYTEAIATRRLPANLVQAQRDFFGAHTYQRTDKEGIFHTPDWAE